MKNLLLPLLLTISSCLFSATEKTAASYPYPSGSVWNQYPRIIKDSVSGNDYFILGHNTIPCRLSVNSLDSMVRTISNGWNLTGNTGTNPSTNFIGTSDNTALLLYSNGNDQLAGNSSNLASIFLRYANGSDKGDYEMNITDSANDYSFIIEANGKANNAMQHVASNFDQSISTSIIQTKDSIQVSSATSSMLYHFFSDVDIDGSLQLQLPTGYAYGQVLTSDASGNASWKVNTPALDSTTIYALTPIVGQTYFCTNCTGNHYSTTWATLVGGLITWTGSLWRRNF